MKKILLNFLRWLTSLIIKMVYGYAGFYVAFDYSHGNVRHFDIYADAVDFFNAKCEDCEMYVSLYARLRNKGDKRLLHLSW